MNIALVSPPWHPYGTVSTQLGALKGYLSSRVDHGVTCFEHALVVYSRLGAEVSRFLSLSPVPGGEILYACLLHQDLAQDLISRMLRLAPAGNPLAGNTDQILAVLRRESEKLADQIIEGGFQIVGFSNSYNQLNASLHLAGLVKKRDPSRIIVFGGGLLVGDIARRFLRHNPVVDHVITGEGEEGMTRLVAAIAEGLDDLSAVPNLLWRAGGRVLQNSRQEIEDLDTLSYPDYSDSLDTCAELDLTPEVPMETARGCWWYSSTKRSHDRCLFCNACAAFGGYRQKSAERAANELAHLVDVFHTTDVSFLDNCLRSRELDLFLTALERCPHDLSIRWEIRARLPVAAMLRMKDIGVRSCAIGVEALADGLLERIRKGVRVLHLIQAIKILRDIDIGVAANLIVGLPGETCEDLEVTRENLVSLDHLLGVESLNFSNFTLDHGSWYLDDPGRHGLSNVRPGRFHHLRFPGPEAAEMVPLDYAFDLNTSAREREELASRWEGVMQLVESNETDQQRKLVQVHGGDWIDILDLRRHQPEPYTYRLRGDQAEIYRYCHISRPLRRVHRRFPHVAAASIDRFLDDLEGKRLIYKDGDGCISLALARDSHRALRQYQDLLRANDEAVETQTAKT